MIKISTPTPFSSGGNRDCFVHPENPHRCLKVLREGRSPRERRKQKKFPANLRPLATFDENITELQTLSYIFKAYPPRIHQYVARAYGFVLTDRGSAIETDLIRDSNGLISMTLEQHLWKFGLNPQIKQALTDFLNDWSSQAPTTRAFIPHNLLLQETTGSLRIQIIDGLGRQSRYMKFLQTLPFYNRFEKRKANLYKRIQRISDLLEQGIQPPKRVANLKREF